MDTSVAKAPDYLPECKEVVNTGISLVQQNRKKSNRPLVIGIVGVVVLVLLAVSSFLIYKFVIQPESLAENPKGLSENPKGLAENTSSVPKSGRAVQVTQQGDAADPSDDVKDSVETTTPEPSDEGSNVFLKIKREYDRIYRKLSLLASGKEKEVVMGDLKISVESDCNFDITVKKLEDNCFYPDPFHSELAIELLEKARVQPNPKQTKPIEPDENSFPVFSPDVIPLTEPIPDSLLRLHKIAKSYYDQLQPISDDLKLLDAIESFRKANKEWIQKTEISLLGNVEALPPDTKARGALRNPADMYLEANRVHGQMDEGLKKKIEGFKLLESLIIPEMKVDLEERFAFITKSFNTALSAIIFEASMVNLKAKGLLKEKECKSGFIPGFKYIGSYLDKPEELVIPNHDPLGYHTESVFALMKKYPDALMLSLSPRLPKDSLTFDPCYRMENSAIATLDAFIINAKEKKPANMPQGRSPWLYMLPTTEFSVRGRIEIRRMVSSISAFAKIYGFKRLVLDLGGWKAHSVPIHEILNQFKAIVAKDTMSVDVSIDSIPRDMQKQLLTSKIKSLEAQVQQEARKKQQDEELERLRELVKRKAARGDVKT